MLDSPEKYKKGVAFYAARSTFFLPEEEMTEEELLELIDFREKRDYSLAKITEEIEAGVPFSEAFYLPNILLQPYIPHCVPYKAHGRKECRL